MGGIKKRHQLGVAIVPLFSTADLHDLLGTVILYHLELQQEENPVQTASLKSIAMINALQPKVMTQVKSSAQTIWAYLRKSLSLLEEEQIPAYVHSLCDALFEGQSNRSQPRALNPMALCTLLSLLEAVELDGRLRVDQVMPKFSEANRLRLVRSLFTHWKDEISPMSGTMAAEGEAYMAFFNDRNFLGNDEIRRALIKAVRIPSLLKVEEEDTAYLGWSQSNRSWHVLCRDWNRPLLDWWRVLRTQARFQEGQSSEDRAAFNWGVTHRATCPHRREADMAIKNNTDDNLVAEWQGVEVPNELQAPAHERAALLVRDGKLVTGLSTEPGLFVAKLVPSTKLQEDELQELLGERIASVYRREMLAVAVFSDPAIGGFPGGSAAHYWDRIREDFASMSKHVLFEKGDAAIKHAVRRLGGDQLDGFIRLLLILSALRLDGRLDESSIRGFLSYHVANADYPVWRTIAMELLEPLTMAQTADTRMERRHLLNELQPLADDAIRQELIRLADLPEHYREMNTHNLLRGMAPRGRGKYAWSYLLDGLNYPWLDLIQLVRYRLAHLENYANYKDARCLMWAHMKQLRKDLRQIYGTRK